MTTKDEALKLALEALGWTDEWRPQGLKEKAITALREALASQGEALNAPLAEQPAQQEPEHIVHSNGRYSPLLTRMMNERVKSNVKQVIELYDSPEQPAPATELREQEPVATVAEVHMSRYTIEWTNGPLPEGTELYTSPPAQRKPLTDEEIDDLAEHHGLDCMVYEPFARAIEAKLKAKNFA